MRFSITSRKIICIHSTNSVTYNIFVYTNIYIERDVQRGRSAMEQRGSVARLRSERSGVSSLGGGALDPERRLGGTS